jgi:hypothetical protein
MVEVNHIDVKIPSEHTICGERYDAEYSIVMLHPKVGGTLISDNLKSCADFNESAFYCFT